MPSLTHLSAQERLDLIGQLWDSLEDDNVSLTPAQRAELDRRLAALDEGGEALRRRPTCWKRRRG